MPRRYLLTRYRSESFKAHNSPVLLALLFINRIDIGRRRGYNAVQEILPTTGIGKSIGALEMGMDRNRDLRMPPPTNVQEKSRLVVVHRNDDFESHKNPYRPTNGQTLLQSIAFTAVPGLQSIRSYLIKAKDSPSSSRPRGR